MEKGCEGWKGGVVVAGGRRDAVCRRAALREDAAETKEDGRQTDAGRGKRSRRWGRKYRKKGRKEGRIPVKEGSSWRTFCPGTTES